MGDPSSAEAEVASRSPSRKRHHDDDQSDLIDWSKVIGHSRSSPPPLATAAPTLTPALDRCFDRDQLNANIFKPYHPHPYPPQLIPNRDYPHPNFDSQSLNHNNLIPKPEDGYSRSLDSPGLSRPLDTSSPSHHPSPRSRHPSSSNIIISNNPTGLDVGGSNITSIHDNNNLRGTMSGGGRDMMAMCEEGGEGGRPRGSANARERDRTHSVNTAFVTLRTLIPTGQYYIDFPCVVFPMFVCFVVEVYETYFYAKCVDSNSNFERKKCSM